MSRPDGCLSDLAFDELHAGELAPSARRELEAHVLGCARCRERRAELRAEHEALLAAAPSLAALAPSATPAGKPSKRQRVLAIGGAALGLAAAALLMVVARNEPALPGVRSKGAPHLGLYVKRGERVLAAASGARVRPGDLVRFTYSSDRERHLALLSLDARGAQVYFPASEGRAQRVRAGMDVGLDFSVELDATEGDEQVFGLFCEQAIELAVVREALAKTRALPELEGCAIDRVVLHKELVR